MADHSNADCFSFGGGVQSTAALVLAAQGEHPLTRFVMANVGDDSENPDTVTYIEEHAKPYAAAHDLELIIVRKTWRDGKQWSLLRYLHEVESSIPIPVRLPGAGPTNRLCTIRWKMEPIVRWQRDRGATFASPAVVGIGISTDEIQRARTSSRFPEQTLNYPLLDLGLSRQDCFNIIDDAGLPRPPKSSCWFCPFKSKEQWRQTRREHPETWDKAVALEQMLIDRRIRLGKDPAYLASNTGPLELAIDDQLSMFGTDELPDCEESSCFT